MISELWSTNDGIRHVIGPLLPSTLNLQVAFWLPTHYSRAELQIQIGNDNNAPNHDGIHTFHQHLVIGGALFIFKLLAMNTDYGTPVYQLGAKHYIRWYIRTAGAHVRHPQHDVPALGNLV